MLALLRRVYAIIRANITWWRGIRVPLCPSCGGVLTDDALPQNPEPAYCMPCAERRAKERQYVAAAVKAKARQEWHAKAHAANRAMLVAADALGLPRMVALNTVGDTLPLAYYDADGRLLMRRDPVRGVVQIGDTEVTYAELLRVDNPRACLVEKIGTFAVRNH